METQSTFVKTRPPCGDTVHLVETRPPCEDTVHIVGPQSTCEDTIHLVKTHPPCGDTVHLVGTQSTCGATVHLEETRPPCEDTSSAIGLKNELHTSLFGQSTLYCRTISDRSDDNQIKACFRLLSLSSPSPRCAGAPTVRAVLGYTYWSPYWPPAECGRWRCGASRHLTNKWGLR